MFNDNIMNLPISQSLTFSVRNLGNKMCPHCMSVCVYVPWFRGGNRKQCLKFHWIFEQLENSKLQKVFLIFLLVIDFPPVSIFCEQIFIIDCEAREIINLVASVCPSVCLFVYLSVCSLTAEPFDL